MIHGARPADAGPVSAPAQLRAAVANGELVGFTFEPLYQDGVLATLRGRADQRAAGRPILIVTAGSERQAAEAVHYLNNEYALRDRLSPAWARAPQGIAWRHGAMALVYHDDGEQPLAQFMQPVAAQLTQPVQPAQPGDVAGFLALAISVCGAVGAMHAAGMLHQNIKPANIMVDHAGRCRLAGFGVASLMGTSFQPGASAVLRGTPCYMSPEQTGRVQLAVDVRSDLYSLGVTLYELLTGRLPFSVAHPANASEWIHAHLASEPAPPTWAGAPVPAMLARILLKLLAKNPQERYQDAASLAADFKQCEAAWQSDGVMPAFGLGLDGAPALRLCTQLHGREQPMADLLAAYDRLGAQGAAELVLVHGPSGVGKSALVAQLLRHPQLRTASVGSAKVDQFAGAAPYVALTEALRSLMLCIMGQSRNQVDFWRQRVQQALAADPKALDLAFDPALDLVPELSLLAGTHSSTAPRPPPASGRESADRLVLAAMRLIELFALAERPLILAIDDVQWLDPATLALLEEVTVKTRNLPFMLLLTSRSGYGADGVALPVAAQRLRGRAVHGIEVELAPLARESLEAMLADMLSATRVEVVELAAQVHQKTAGNPYFVQQFVQTLVHEGLARRASGDGPWTFDLDVISALRHTDNVAELALARLDRLPEPTRRVLGALSCLGRIDGTDMLCTLHGVDQAQLTALLDAAVAADVVTAAPSGYVFTHDRLQEAAYAELEAGARERLHAQIGRLMVASALAGDRDDQLFGAMDHLKRALHLLQPAERMPVARAAMLAGRKARRACAYDSALSYLDMAHALAIDDSAPVSQLRFDADLERAHCLCFGGQLDAARAMLPVLQATVLRASPQHRRLQGLVLRLAAEIDVRRGDYAQAVRWTLEGLRAFGIDMPEHPTDAQCARAYADVRVRLQGDWRATLYGLPRFRAPADVGDVAGDDAEYDMAADTAVILSLLAGLLIPTTFNSSRLLFLHLCHTLQVGLDRGMSGETAAALAWFGVMVGERYSHFAEGCQYAVTARALVERDGYDTYATPVLLALCRISVWTQPLTYSLSCAEDGYDAALAAGDMKMASLELCQRICIILVRGDPLDVVAADIARARAFVAQLEFRDMDKILLVQQQFIEYLRGGDDAALLLGTADEDSMPTLLFWHLVYQAGPAFLSGDNARALACLRQAGTVAWAAPAHIHLMEYHLFSVLALCAEDVTGAAHEAQIASHLAPLANWARTNPATFADKHAMAKAALCVRAGDAFGALALYDQAIMHAQAQGFNHYVGFIHELAARLCERQGHVTGARAHTRGAVAAYRRWGALRRASELEAELAPTRHDAGAAPAQDTVSIIDTADIRDIDSVIRSARALSEEIQVAPLVRALMTIALEHASAQRGLLIRMNGDLPLLEAAAELTARGVEVDLTRAAPSAQDLPLTMLHMAMRTLKPVGVAANPGPAPRAAPFDADPYLAHHVRCSAICIPMLKQTRLVGMLYLENRVASAAFTSEQARVLLLLAAQAAVSLETAALYAELLEENEQRREAEKALRESRAMMLQGEQLNRSGSWTWNLSQNTINGTPELARIFNLAESQPTMPVSVFVDALHPDDQPRVWRILDQALAKREAYAMEYRVVDPDGKVRHLSCVGEPLAGTGGGVFVGTTIDITARRAADDSLRQAQAELARVARVTTVGQLTSAIAHEINQPLMSISSNAGASLRWLERDPPQLDRVRSGLQEIAAQSQRAGGIIRGLRALTRKGEQESAPLDLHATIRHIISISRSELERLEVSLELGFKAHSGWVHGDAVQLQQVLLNVVVNALDAMAGVRGRARNLTITTASEHGMLVVRIDDTGSGIDDEGAAKMFEPYYTTKDDGMGMGLAICRSIMEAHGGSIAAVARRPHGCSIEFRLSERV